MEFLFGVTVYFHCDHNNYYMFDNRLNHQCQLDQGTHHINHHESPQLDDQSYLPITQNALPWDVS